MNPPLPSLPPVESSRLITLSDGRPGLRGGIHVEVREPNLASSSSASASVLDFVASDETLDRYDEIITASGWKLESYHRNPVFQNAHKYGDIIFTLGKALVTEIRSPSSNSHLTSPILFQRIEFATDVNPMAKIAYGLYRGKFLNAVSVGFVPVRWEVGSEKTSYRRKYLEQELLEVSAVGIPANPNALALGLKSGAIEKSDLKDTLDLLRSFSDSEFKVEMASPARTSVLDVRSSPSFLSSQPSTLNHQPLLELSRTLRDLMRHIICVSCPH